MCCALLLNAFSSCCSFYDRHADYVTTAGVEIKGQALRDIVLDVEGNLGQGIEV